MIHTDCATNYWSKKGCSFHSQNSEMMATEKKALTKKWTCMGKAAQGQLGSVFCNQSHLIVTTLILLDLWIVQYVRQDLGTDEFISQ